MLAVLVGVTGYAPALRPATVARRATPYRAMPLMVGPDDADMTSPRVRTVCVALLGQLTKLEEEIGVLDFNGFSAFVDKLEVECDIEDKQSIFAMIDKDGGGSVRHAGTQKPACRTVPYRRSSSAVLVARFAVDRPPQP